MEEKMYLLIVARQVQNKLLDRIMLGERLMSDVIENKLDGKRLKGRTTKGMMKMITKKDTWAEPQRHAFHKPEYRGHYSNWLRQTTRRRWRS